MNNQLKKPKLLLTNPDIFLLRIAAGFHHCLAIKKEDKAFLLSGWGSPESGALGTPLHPSPPFICSPQLILLRHDYKKYAPLQLSCGQDFSLVLAQELLEEKIQIGEPKNIIPVLPPRNQLFVFGGRFTKKKEPKKKEKDIDGDYKFIVEEGVKVGDNKEVKMGACGARFALALDEEGGVWGWGEGSAGTLGNGDYTDSDMPISIPFPSSPIIRFISCGFFHCAALSKENCVYTWGGGSEGQLGHGDNLNLSFPKKVVSFTNSKSKGEDFEKDEEGMNQTNHKENIIMISCGMHHTVCINEKGFVFSWGGNKNGQLGLGDYNGRNKPEILRTLKNNFASYVTCGANTTFIIVDDDRIFAFGSNSNNRLLLPSDNEEDISNTINTPIMSLLSPQTLSNFFELKKIGKASMKIYQIITSNQFSIALTNRGDLITWGKNHSGCLGIGQELDEEIEFRSTPDNVLNRVENFEGKASKKEKPSELNLSSNFIDIKCGLYHSAGLTNAGQVYIWGSNQYYQHGISPSTLKNTINFQSEKIKFHLDYFNRELIPTLVKEFDIAKNQKITQIACGFEYVFAVQNSKLVFSWGKNTHGQLGLGSVCEYIKEPSPLTFFDEHIIKDVVCGEKHTLILDDLGDLYSFGCPSDGKLGLGFMTTLQILPKKIGIKNVVYVACGPNHSLALVEEITLKEKRKDEEPENEKKEEEMEGEEGMIEIRTNTCYSWGKGFDYQLGHGNTDNLYSPKAIETKYVLGKVACGTHHSAGITDDGKIVVWGPFKYLGIPKQTEVVEDEAGTIIDKWLISEYMKPTLHPKLYYDNIQFENLILGDKYNLALTSKKDLYVWGLFDAAYQKEIKKVSKEIQSSEEFFEKILVIPKKIGIDTKFEALSCSKNHCLAIQGGKVFSWGIDGNTGRLGLGYEYFDEEDVGEKKGGIGRGRKEEQIMKSHDQLIETPQNLNYLNTFLAKKFIEEKKAIQTTLFEVGKGSIGKVSGSRNSNRDKSNTSSGIFEQQPTMSGKKSKLKPSKSKVSNNAASVQKEQSRYSSHQSTIPDEDKFDLFENCHAEGEDNVLNHNNTEKLYNKNKLLYDVIENRLKERAQNIYERKMLKKRVVGIILKRITSQPFEANFLKKKDKLAAKERLAIFFRNKKKFSAICTILQLHPCYLLNIYNIQKFDNDEFLNVIFQVFGDIENDVRKTRLLSVLTLEILKSDLMELVRTTKTDELGAFCLEMNHAKSNRFSTFSRLFSHIFLSFYSSRLFSKFCVKSLKADFKKDIIDPDNTQFFKRYAIVFRDLGQVNNEADKKKAFETKIKFLIKLMNHIFIEFLKFSNNLNLQISEEVKNFVFYAKEIFMKYSNLVPKINADTIKRNFLNLAFAPVFEAIQELESLPAEIKIDEDKSVQRLLKHNYESFRIALEYFLNCKNMTAVDFPKETWLDELNNFINHGDEIRNQLYNMLFSIDQDQLEPDVDLENQFMLYDLFNHSLTEEVEIIAIDIKTIIYITNMIHNHLEDFHVIQPLEKDILYNIHERLKDDLPELNKIPSEARSEKFNLKLLTQQLLRGGKEKSIKQCVRCHTFLVEDFLRSEDLNIIESFSILNPESLESVFLKFISLKIVSKKTYDSFFHHRIDVKHVLNDLVTNNHDIKYQEIQAIKTFKQKLEEHPKKIANENSLSFNEKNDLDFQILKDLKNFLEDKASKALTYTKINSNLENILNSISTDILSKSENFNYSFYQHALKLCFYGLANKEFEKPLQNNPSALTGKIGASIRSSYMSNDLYENMEYLLDEKNKNFSLFGCYSYKTLKAKEIIESLNLEILNKLDALGFGMKPGTSSYKLKQMRNNFVYMFTDNKQQGLQIELIYKHSTFNLWTCGSSSKKKNFEVVLEKSELTEEQILTMRKVDRELTEKKQITFERDSNKPTFPIGKYSKFYLSTFIDLLNSLQNHYMIYDDIFIKDNSNLLQ